MENSKETQEGKRHALLSPSAASRWMECTPSAVMESRCPDAESDYAAEGSMAHAVCALRLTAAQGRDTSAIEEEIAALAGTADPVGMKRAEMDRHADDYAEMVLGLLAEEGEGAELHVETPLDLDDWAPGSFGTSDAVIVGRTRITVVDYKYGTGVPVSAEGNAQMRMYALGALSEFGVERYVDTVRMVIWQPRISNYSTEEITARELVEWGENRLAPLARVAALGLGNPVAGRWCRFCRAAGACPALDYVAVKAMETPPDRQDARSLGERCLPMVPVLRQWIESVEGRALSAMLDGERVPGFKLVEKLTRRAFTDTSAVYSRLVASGLSSDRFMTAPEVRPITQLEKLLGKKGFGELLGDLVEKKPGDPTVAPESDRRKAITAADRFNGIEI